MIAPRERYKDNEEEIGVRNAIDFPEPTPGLDKPITPKPPPPLEPPPPLFMCAENFEHETSLFYLSLELHQQNAPKNFVADDESYL
ncbi:hypothetical protein FRX31_030331 [Thalictrum thalictroides]|uniref:Uncharacterized protein n=1 Tax=Thalictrum thalictroides TaxID=46969 RepID=A0A7J6V6P0_THATH|nr:hypothetical protein FRX31_030331 [Thalictrum thalictroides]